MTTNTEKVFELRQRQEVAALSIVEQFKDNIVALVRAEQYTLIQPMLDVLIKAKKDRKEAKNNK